MIVDEVTDKGLLPAWLQSMRLGEGEPGRPFEESEPIRQD
jgi:hypothetical protein